MFMKSKDHACGLPRAYREKTSYETKRVSRRTSQPNSWPIQVLKRSIPSRMLCMVVPPCEMTKVEDIPRADGRLYANAAAWGAVGRGKPGRSAERLPDASRRPVSRS